MIKFEQLVLVSYNVGKFKEFQVMFGVSVKVCLIGEFSQVELEEIGFFFVENVIFKVCNVVCFFGLLVLVDDFGLVVDFFGGVLGIYLVCYVDGWGDVVNNVKLLEVMKDVLDVECGVQFVSVLVLVCYVDDLLLIFCEGIWEGCIFCEVCGVYGFGYDLLFWVLECDCFSVELVFEEKNCFSY